MKPAELRFRHWLGPKMADQWMMTWHEDRHISPGVPDLHYVMGIGHRVGWLELKALDAGMINGYKIRVEPSQHQYIRRWLPFMSIHFLVRIKRHIYLIDGVEHVNLSAAVDENSLAAMSVCQFHQDDILKYLPDHLRKITGI